MHMLGTIVNVGAIVAGSLIGGAIRHRFNPVQQERLFEGLGLCALMIGIKCAIDAFAQNGNAVVMILSLTTGVSIGTFLRLHQRINSATTKLSGNGELASGLITAVLLFCIGALSILGPMKSALNNDHSLLLTNACLDLLTSMALASTYGYMIMLSAIVLFLFQGFFYVLALLIKGYLPDYIISNILLCGAVMILGSGLSILRLKAINSTDFLPALIIAPIIAWLGHISGII